MDARRELIKKTARYAKEDVATTWRLFAVTLLVFAATHAAIVLVPYIPLKLLFSVLTGLVWVRLFIFFHDWAHGAIFRGSRWGSAVMWVYGLLTLSPPSVWRETHDYHHKHNAKLPGTSIGSFPVVSIATWRVMSPSQRRWYAFARHPLNMLFGYFTVFLGGMCLAAFRRAPSLHWQAPVAVAVHAATMVSLIVAWGWQVALWHLVLPVFVATALGSYVFYVQHNFPDVRLRRRRDWDYVDAARYSSSMFEMSPVLHWLTGNIGYHHIHHLNHRIPFYRLPQVMEEVPELQDAGRTSWHPKDIWACLRLKLWDPESGRMVHWNALDEAAAVRSQALDRSV